MSPGGRPVGFFGSAAGPYLDYHPSASWSSRTTRSRPSISLLTRYWSAPPASGSRRTILKNSPWVYCCCWSRSGEKLTSWPTTNLCVVIIPLSIVYSSPTLAEFREFAIGSLQVRVERSIKRWLSLIIFWEVSIRWWTLARAFLLWATRRRDSDTAFVNITRSAYQNAGGSARVPRNQWERLISRPSAPDGSLPTMFKHTPCTCKTFRWSLVVFCALRRSMRPLYAASFLR